jgi:hypothetical protein
MSSIEADIEALRAENEQIAQQVKALKKKLGLDIVERAQEQKRVAAVFALFDTDKSGFIETTEFQALAAHLGIYLTADAAAKQVANIDASGAARLSFDDFFAWVENRESGEVSLDAEERDISALRLQLQSSALVRSASALKRQVSESFAAKPVTMGETFKLRLNVHTVDLDAAPLSVGVAFYNDAARAAAFAAETENGSATIETPLRNQTILALEFNVADSATDESIGEIAGAMDPFFEMLPPVCQIEHHFALETDANGKRFIRLTLHADMDALATAEAMLPGVNPADFIKAFEVLLESGLDLKAVLAEDFSDIASLFRYRALFNVEVENSFIDLIRQMMGPGSDPKGWAGATLLKLFRNLDIELKTFDVAQELTGEGSLAMYAPMIMEFLQGQLQAVSALEPEMLSAMLDESVDHNEMLADFARGLLRNLTGVRRVVVQNQDVGFELKMRGLDVLSLLPPM